MPVPPLIKFIWPREIQTAPWVTSPTLPEPTGVVVVNADRRKLDAMSFTHAHQGVIALAAAHAYAYR